ncbi:helix-turn-helix domain-containing protein [Microbacterium sp. 179-I 3D2 NHS]|uniref:helix-turn-helix domain-containing protein n=1 Tax=Microbacterium sp. 179-I 3D2 NHS TaxID=3235178 RepID=UPI0039A2C739
MATERQRGNEIGPTGETVAANIARVRRGIGMSLQELESRLDMLGRRISFSGLSKIERGQKRVEVDDLMALAIALDVSPNALLLPIIEEPDRETAVTGAEGSLALFWQWATAEETPFSGDKRAFVARSLPWWMDQPSPSLRWHGDLELFMSVAGGERRHIETHRFSARNRSDMDWDRPRD